MVTVMTSTGRGWGSGQVCWAGSMRITVTEPPGTEEKGRPGPWPGSRQGGEGRQCSRWSRLSPPRLPLLSTKLSPLMSSSVSSAKTAGGSGELLVSPVYLSTCGCWCDQPAGGWSSALEVCRWYAAPNSTPTSTSRPPPAWIKRRWARIF